MKAEDTQSIIDGALEGLAQDLAAGRSEQLTRYLAFLGRFHIYSFRNILLIWSQRPTATHIAGYRAWLAMGRQVRKGEKGIAIRAPMRLRTAAKDSQSGTDTRTEREEQDIRFRIAHVFDVAQTDGEPLPELATVQGDPGPMLERLRSFAAGKGIIVRTDPSFTMAMGASHGGRITLRPGLTAAAEFSTLAHEIAHELLHQNVAVRPNQSVRELEAEAVAFAVSTAAGLDSGTASRDYIHLYQGDTERLIECLSRIRSVAHEIAASLTETREETHQAAA